VRVENINETVASVTDESIFKLKPIQPQQSFVRLGQVTDALYDWGGERSEDGRSSDDVVVGGEGSCANQTLRSHNHSGFGPHRSSAGGPTPTLILLWGWRCKLRTCNGVPA